MSTTETKPLSPTRAEETRPGGLREVEPRTVKQWLETNEAVLIDVREEDEYAREHIEGAELHSLSNFHPSNITVRDGKRLVLHCRTGNRSTDAASRLLAAGADEVYHVAGGLKAWRAAGLPVKENRKVPISIMRQVQIAAGSLILLGTVLGALVNPWWLLLSGFVGAGLVFAGVSGTCGMATLLQKMPWNKVFTGACEGKTCGK